jgi:hypothetical protein
LPAIGVEVHSGALPFSNGYIKEKVLHKLRGFLDVAGPFMVFSVTRFNDEHREGSPPFRVLLISERMGQVLANGGLRFIPLLLWIIARIWIY